MTGLLPPSAILELMNCGCIYFCDAEYRSCIANGLKCAGYKTALCKSRIQWMMTMSLWTILRGWVVVMIVVLIQWVSNSSIKLSSSCDNNNWQPYYICGWSKFSKTSFVIYPWYHIILGPDSLYTRMPFLYWYWYLCRKWLFKNPCFFYQKVFPIQSMCLNDC